MTPPALHVVDAVKHREFRAIADGWYRLSLLREGITFDIKRLRWDRGELFGLLEVRCELPGAQTIDGVLSMGTFNFTSVTARRGRATELASATRAPEIDFRLLLEEVCQRTMLAEQSGTPVVLLQSLEPRAIDQRILTVFGLPLYLQHPQIMYGLGGTGKTTIASGLLVEMERRGIPTLFLDWELDEYSALESFRRLAAVDFSSLAFKYRRCERPLFLEAEAIAKQIDECGIEFVICDSAGYASDGRPEDAEVALRYARALRQLRVGSLTLAHISSGEHGADKPFGSVFWHNSARSTWYLERSTQSRQDNAIVVGCYQKKNNLGKLQSAVGLQVDFGSARTDITSTDLADDEQLAGKLPLWQRVAYLLKNGPLTIVEIGQALDAKVDTVTKAVNRSKSFTKVTNHPDGIHRIALVERRIA